MNKVRISLLGMLLGALLLSGCGGSSTRSIFTGTENVSGTYQGEESGGVPQGAGVFTAEAGWSFTGSFSDGGFERGQVKALPTQIATAGGSVFAGSYTGAVTELTPDGEGEIVDVALASFAGSFSGGSAADGAATALPCTVLFGGEAIEGVYTGLLAAGLPEGEGEFLSDAGGRTLRYQGGFAAGAPSGEGELYDDGYTVHFGDGAMRGVYEGSALSGLPDGHGTFRSRTADNVDSLYDGQWSAGLWEGEGSLTYDSQRYYDRVGTFTSGRFTPTAQELFAALGSVEPLFTVSDTKLTFLETYPELYDNTQSVPDYLTCPYRSLWQGLNYDAYKAAPGSFEKDCWMLFYNYAILRQWEDDALGGDYTFTRILASNTVYTNPIECLVFGKVTNLSKATRFTAYGIPLGTSTYTNADGEAVDCLVVLIGAMGVY